MLCEEYLCSGARSSEIWTSFQLMRTEEAIMSRWVADAEYERGNIRKSHGEEALGEYPYDIKKSKSESESTIFFE